MLLPETLWHPQINRGGLCKGKTTFIRSCFFFCREEESDEGIAAMRSKMFD